MFALGLCAGLCSEASAQNALGTGNALDANPRQGSNGVNERGRDINAIIRQSNAVVDGTAGSGRSFQDFTGTRSGSSFRDSLGGTENYRFLRDSSISGLATSRARSSDVLSAQSALYVGNPVATDFASALNPREYGAATSGSTLASLRSTAQRDWDLSRQPSVLGIVTARDDTRRPVSYQPLRGISFGSRDRADVLPLSPLERPARLSIDADLKVTGETTTSPLTGRPGSAPSGTGTATPGATPGSVGRPGPGNTGASNTLTGMRISTRMDDVTEAYRIAKLAEDARIAAANNEPTSPARLNRFDADMAALRDKLNGRSPSTRRGGLDGPSTTVPGATSSTPANSRDPNAPKPPTIPSASERLDKTLPPGVTPPNDQADPDAAVRLLKQMTSGKPLTGLAQAPRSETDWYNVIMVRAGLLVEEGKYFQAEEVYTRLLSAKEGDPLARIGRIHAQIGAGAYLTAGKGLADVLRDRPELIGTRVSTANLLPAARVTEATAELTKEVANPKSAIASESGLLLAYLGFQTGNANAVSAGLAAMKRDADQGDAASKALVAVLSEVWSAAPSQPPTGDSK